MRYAHANIVAQDWRRLSSFYVEVLGCREIRPPRDLSGKWLEQGTGVPGAALEGVHLLLPGYGEDGPTLEIFTYAKTLDCETLPANRRGLRHLAFDVESVEEAASEVVAAGGSLVGKIVEHSTPGVGTLRFVYAADPEGNIIELKSWDRKNG